MVDREGANKCKMMFQDDEDEAHSKKQNQEHKGQQKTEVMQPPVFP